MRQGERTADAETKIELPIERFIRAHDPVAIDVCVQGVVNVKEIGLAVKIVAAGFDREVDDATGRITKLLIVAAGGECEFLERVWPWCDLGEERAVLTAPCLCTVNENVCAESLPAVDAEVRGVRSRATGSRACGSPVVRYHTAVEEDE